VAGAWRKVTEDIQATFTVEGSLADEEFLNLGQDLREAAGAGYRHLVLDLSQCQRDSLHDWAPFRPVVEDLTHQGTRLSVLGAAPEILEGLHSATVEAQMRWLERQCPGFFSKTQA